MEPIKISVDNKSTIALAKNPVYHDLSKHIDTRYHYIREYITKQDVWCVIYLSILELIFNKF